MEAVVDIRVKLRSDFEMAAFLELRSQLADRYPNVEEGSDFELSTEWKPGTVPQSSGRVGEVSLHLFRSQDGKEIVQLRRNGFSFSRLNPYTSWEEVFTEAWRLWELYAQTAKPLEVSRLAVRYINRLLLPGTNVSLFLNPGPLLAEGWPSEIGTFLSRIVLIDRQEEIAVNVVQTLEPRLSSEQPIMPVIFDIDAFQSGSLNAEDMTIRDRFARLREMKNRIFFNGITPQAVELFR